MVDDKKTQDGILVDQQLIESYKHPKIRYEAALILILLHFIILVFVPLFNDWKILTIYSAPAIFSLLVFDLIVLFQAFQNRSSAFILDKINESIVYIENGKEKSKFPVSQLNNLEINISGEPYDPQITLFAVYKKEKLKILEGHFLPYEIGPILSKYLNLELNIVRKNEAMWVIGIIYIMVFLVFFLSLMIYIVTSL
ncbi:MAG: hypothetical protein ACXAC2_13815 [Candidatus Kariarchaeaceae archaeon]|jgi:hypothetical protein